ncbi:methanol/ethanol family PQQ-dependent dehydrogenase [Paracraurococcus lichenis]|uniref:Methanol/ethanol family PQQ-dependent dehydrogenase n=1 Tax=Paracraurococcus lichenis TaxID=3064888 RepID=A0ABT9DV31_9PROT|nr:methanol/ethanol family PQQ-dependent dehydrogenase [Paracraurococcus sp. LOR1-02]MDO9707655.1 methanol/ethanol family PQQ-dependent dehydrogenase [Paracraurococcus sp. LOR1-02]
MSKRSFKVALLGAVAGLSLAAAAQAQKVENSVTPATPVPPLSERTGTQGAAAPRTYTPVTDARLQKPEARNWLMYRGTYDGHGFSPLDQVNAGNVRELVPVWSFSTGVTEGHQSPPIVNDGVMFVTTPQAQVIALDAKTGEMLWRYKRQLPEDLTQLHPTNRGVALYGDKVYVATTDCYLVALDAKTGKEVWAKKVEDYQKGHYMTLAPLIARGKVMVGGSGGEYGVRGFIAGYDVNTGEQAWKTFTIPGPGEPGHDTWKNGWETGGGSIWLTGQYDPQLNLAYWGTGNAAPWMGDARPGDNLHTSSVLAINPDDGKIRGHHQYHWNDSWDWDEVSAPLLINLDRNGRSIPTLVHAGRDGYLWTLERRQDGIRFISGVPFVNQDVFAKLDPETGRPTYNEARKPRLDNKVEFCPSLWGGKDWPPEAYNPQTKLLYIPANENLCGALTGHRMDYVPGQLFLGAGLEDIGMSLKPGATHIGELQAWDLTTMKKVWSHPFPNSQLWGPVLTTGGGLVFMGGTNDRMFRAFDAKSGQQLWQTKLNSGVTAVPSTFEVDGTQYIAVQSGWGVDAQRMQDSLVAIDPVRFKSDVPQGGVVWVFALRQRAGQ